MLVLTALIAFAACSKQDQQRPLRSIPPIPGPPVAGTEVVFDSLVWQREDFFDNVFLSIENRPDIFLYSAGAAVSLRLDTSSTWIFVNASSGFAYTIVMGRFYLAPSPWNTTLENTYASVKIKF